METAEQQRPFTYPEIAAMHARDRVANPEFYGRMSLPEYASYQDSFGGNGRYAEGTKSTFGRLIGRVNRGINQAFDATGLPQIAGSLLQTGTEAVGLPQFGQTAYKMGEGLPRFMAEMALMPEIKAGAWTGQALAKFAPSAVSMFSKYYDEPDSNWASILAGVGSQFLMPYGGAAGANIATRGVKAITPATSTVPGSARAIGENLATLLGSMVGTSATMEAGRQVASKAITGAFADPFTAENIFSHVVGNMAALVHPGTYEYALHGPRYKEGFTGTAADALRFKDMEVKFEEGVRKTQEDLARRNAITEQERIAREAKERADALANANLQGTSIGVSGPVGQAPRAPDQPKPAAEPFYPFGRPGEKPTVSLDEAGRALHPPRPGEAPKAGEKPKVVVKLPSGDLEADLHTVVQPGGIDIREGARQPEVKPTAEATPAAQPPPAGSATPALSSSPFGSPTKPATESGGTPAVTTKPGWGDLFKKMGGDGKPKAEAPKPEPSIPLASSPAPKPLPVAEVEMPVNKTVVKAAKVDSPTAWDNFLKMYNEAHATLVDALKQKGYTPEEIQRGVEKVMREQLGIGPEHDGTATLDLLQRRFEHISNNPGSVSNEVELVQRVVESLKSDIVRRTDEVQRLINEDRLARTESNIANPVSDAEVERLKLMGELAEKEPALYEVLQRKLDELSKSGADEKATSQFLKSFFDGYKVKVGSKLVSKPSLLEQLRNPEKYGGIEKVQKDLDRKVKGATTSATAHEGENIVSVGDKQNAEGDTQTAEERLDYLNQKGKSEPTSFVGKMDDESGGQGPTVEQAVEEGGEPVAPKVSREAQSVAELYQAKPGTSVWNQLKTLIGQIKSKVGGRIDPEQIAQRITAIFEWRMKPSEYSEAQVKVAFGVDPTTPIGKIQKQIKVVTDTYMTEIASQFGLSKQSKSPNTFIGQDQPVDQSQLTAQERSQLAVQQQSRKSMERKIDAGTTRQTISTESPNAGVLSGRATMQRIFERLGISSELADKYSRMTEVLIASFNGAENTRISELISQSALGIAFNDRYVRADGKALKVAKGGLLGIVAPHTDEAKLREDPEVLLLRTMLLMSHELTHQAVFSLQNLSNSSSAADQMRFQKYKDFMDRAESMTAEDRAGVIRDLANELLPKSFLSSEAGRAFIEDTAVNASTAPNNYGNVGEEFIAEYGSILVMAVASKRLAYGAIEDRVLFSDPAESNFFKGHIRDLVEFGDAIQQYYDFDKTMYPHPTGSTESFGEFMGNLTKSLDVILKSEQKMNAHLDSLAGLASGMTPEQILAGWKTPERIMYEDEWYSDGPASARPKLEPAVSDSIKAAGDIMGLGKEGDTLSQFRGEPMRWYHFLYPIAQLAERFPLTKPVVNAVLAVRPMASLVLTNVMAPFLALNPVTGRYHTAADNLISKIARDGKTLEAFNKVALAHGGREGKPLTDEEIRQSTSDLSREQQDTLIKTVRTIIGTPENNYQDGINGTMRNIIFKGEVDSVGIHLGRLLLAKLKDPKANPQGISLSSMEAVKIGRALAESGLLVLKGSDPKVPDPASFAKGSALTQEALARFTPEIQQFLQEARGPLLEKVNRLKWTLDSRPGFFTERRFGEYNINYKRPKKENGAVVRDEKGQIVYEQANIGAKSEIEAMKAVQKIQNEEKIPSGDIRVVNRWEQQARTAGLDQKLLDAFTDLEKTAYKFALDKLPEEEAKKLAAHYQPGKSVIEEIQNRGMKKYFLQRKLVAGREDLNMLEGTLDYIAGVAHGVSRRYAQDLVGIHLMDPTMQANPQIENIMREWSSKTISPVGKEFPLIKNLTASYFLGGNFSSTVVESMQHMFTLVPQLVRDGAGVGKSYRYMMDAQKDIVGAMIRGDMAKGRPTLADPIENAAFHRALDEQIIDWGVLSELKFGNDLDAVNLKRLAAGQMEGLNIGDLAKNKLYLGLSFLQKLYAMASANNSRLSFISGFRYARESKASGGLGLDPEAAYNYAANLTRTTMFGGGTAARPMVFSKMGQASGVAGIFYTLQGYTFSAIAMTARLMHDAIGKSGLSPAEVAASRKALGVMLGTQVALSGALGLPFAGGLIAMLEQMFPNAQINKKIREGISGLAGDDQELGGTLADAALLGLPSVTVGWDASSRFGLGNILGVDSHSGFDAKGFLGAAGSIVSNMVRGVQDVASGKPDQAVKTLVPQVLRGPLDMMMHEGKFYDSKGQLIMDGTTAQKIMYSLGFRPIELTRHQTAKAMMDRSDEIANKTRSLDMRRLADLYLQGDAGSVREWLMEKERTDPTFDARSGMRQVADWVLKRTLPPDLLEHSSKADIYGRSQIAKSFVGTPDVTEMQKLQMRNQIEMSIGIPGTGVITREEMTRASMIDSVKAQNPLLSRTQAAAIVDRMTHPSAHVRQPPMPVFGGPESYGQ